jgi:hypothetical protein
MAEMEVSTLQHPPITRKSNHYDSILSLTGSFNLKKGHLATKLCIFRVPLHLFIKHLILDIEVVDPLLNPHQ